MKRNIRIMINPGHDSSMGSNGLPIDSGAVNNDYDVYECDIAMDVGMMVADYLKAAGGYDVCVLQQDNLAGEGSYSYRYSVCGQANVNKVDYFISIHCNAATNVEAKGTECLVFQYKTAAWDLAECIQKQIVDNLETEDRGVKQRRDLCVLKNTWMPAVLVEMAFISNEDDVQLLIERKEEFAASIARGVTDYVASLEQEE